MKQIIFIALLAISTFSSAQVFPLWKEGNIPNYQASNGEEQIPERDIVFIRNVQVPTIEALVPSKQSANGVAVLICPGGGYGGVSYDWEGTDVAKLLNSKGIAGFVLKYRMPQAESVVVSHQAPLQDAKRAIRWIKANAKQFNIDADKVGVMGFSAGGHLASTLGTHYNHADPSVLDDIDSIDAKPAFMSLIYPVITLDARFTHIGSRNNLLGKNPTPKMVDYYSNEKQVTNDTPPTFILHSGDDKAVPVENSWQMYASLKSHNVDATLHIYPTGGHGYGLGISRKGAPDWAPLFENWINTLYPSN